MAREVSAKTPTRGFEDLILWNFLSPHSLLNGIQAQRNMGEFVNPL